MEIDIGEREICIAGANARRARVRRRLPARHGLVVSDSASRQDDLPRFSAEMNRENAVSKPFGGRRAGALRRGGWRSDEDVPLVVPSARHRRHGQPDAVAQHREDAPDVGRLPGRGRRAQRWPSAARRSTTAVRNAASCCSAAMNAGSMPSRSTAQASGPHDSSRIHQSSASSARSSSRSEGCRAGRRRSPTCGTLLFRVRSAACTSSGSALLDSQRHFDDLVAPLLIVICAPEPPSML